VSKTMTKCWTALLLAAALLQCTAMWADGDGRRIKTKVNPVYPDLARQMKIVGTVRMEVVVAANGVVKSTRVLGGHPLLIQAANEAIKKWRYEPGPEATTVVEFHFHYE
jgi:TonB family protein